MWPYIQAAFWSGVTFEGLGKLPVNALAVAGFMVLGFGHPAFWLLGLGLEVAFLYALSFNERFRRYVDSTNLPSTPPAIPTDDVSRLDTTKREKVNRLNERIARALKWSRENAGDDFLIVEHNDAALQRLRSMYIGLLATRQNIEATIEQEQESALRKQIAQLEAKMSGPSISDSLRQSKSATIEVLRRRLENLAKKDDILAEIDSDLTRIEAQVDMALENASMRGKPVMISGTMDLASRMLHETFGSDDSDSPLPESPPPSAQ